MHPKDYQKTKRKHQFIGLGLGLVVPIIASPLVAYILWEVYQPKQADLNFYPYGEFYKELLYHDTKLSNFINLSCIGNLALFFSFLWLKKDFMARGVIIATMVWGGISFYSKLG